MKVPQRILAAAAVATLVGLAGPALAQKMTASQWLPPTYAQPIHAYTGMFNRIREATNGKVDVETHFSGSLLPARTTITGVRDGAADIGFVYPAYTPAEMPVASFINSVTFNSSDPLATTLAFTELGYTHKAMKDELDKFKVMLGGTFVTPDYLFMCRPEVKTLEQAKGKRFRTAGAAYTGFTQALGGSAVSVPIGDVYSGMQRGSIDCVMADPTNLVTASFNEVVKHITHLPMGGGTGFQWVIRKESWNKISKEHRQLILDEMVLAIFRTQAEWDKQVAAAFEDAKKRGIVMAEPSADLSKLLAEFKAQFTTDLVKSSTNVPNAQALLDDYNALQKKWSGLLKGIDRKDEKAVVALARKELHSKIDTATYGLK
jgi:TRAP-type transport system periplasmic protein